LPLPSRNFQSQQILALPREIEALQFDYTTPNLGSFGLPELQRIVERKKMPLREKETGEGEGAKAK
jgi:hypothetical protein